MLSNIHYENRGLDKDLLLTLGTCGFVSNNQPVVINGFTGSGKSYLACAIGRQACMQGFRSRYIRVPDLMELLSEATLTTSGRSKLLKKFSGYRLLILDEWLLNDLTELELSAAMTALRLSFARNTNARIGTAVLAEVSTLTQ